MNREYRSIPADKVLKRFAPERQAKINARTLELLEENGVTANNARGLGVAKTKAKPARKRAKREA